MKINQQKIIAQSQEFIFDEVHIVGGGAKNLAAIVSFIILDENGKRVDTKVIEYRGEDFNTFWDNFNSGKFLYEELVANEGFDVEVNEKDAEDSFVNEVKNVVELQDIINNA